MWKIELFEKNNSVEFIKRNHFRTAMNKSVDTNAILNKFLSKIGFTYSSKLVSSKLNNNVIVFTII